MKRRFAAAGILLFGVGLLAGCGGGTKRGPANGWKAVPAAQLTRDQEGQKERAEYARQEMFTRLVGRLTNALGQGGPPAAIPVCQKEAPQIAAEVGRENGVAIGRTSFKLRNSSNQPPEWAKALVEKRVEEPTFLVHPDGWFGAFLPIKLQALCLMCHGPPDSLSPETRETLARLYPGDQATGFHEGDLRGWFWVEVSPSSR